MRNILSEHSIFKNWYVRTMLLVCLALVTILPLLVIFYVLPSFTKLLVESTEDDAVRVARHFATQCISEKKEALTKDSFKKISSKDIETLKTDFRLTKLKVYSPSGETIFSTSPEDIGVVHKDSHIHQIVKSRAVYAEIVNAGSETSEGQIMDVDVAEVYVPLIDSGRLLGIFEVYYKIAPRKKQLDQLLIGSVSLLFSISVGLLILVFVISLKENKNMAAHKLAEDKMLDSERRFRTFFHTSPDAITISLLEDGRIVDINDGFTSLSGYSKKEVLGKSSLSLNLWIEYRDRESLVAELHKYGKLDNYELKLNHKDGHVLEALVSAKVFMLNQEPHILSVTRDISELKKTEKTLQASQNFLQISNRHTEMGPLLNGFIAQIKRLTDCSAIGIRVLDKNGIISYQAYEGFSQEFYKTENSLAIDSLHCMCSDVVMSKIKSPHPFLSEGGSFYVGSTSRFLTTLSEAERNRICDVCSQYGYESVALIPIHMGDNILGLIHVADPCDHMFSEETIAILEGAALQLGTAIERVRAEEALQESHRQLEFQVKERTAQLVSANELLNLEIEERKHNERKLMEQQDKLRRLSSELLLTEERERRHIATELHDRIGQTLAVAKIKLSELKAASPTSETAEALDEIRGFIEQTILDTRSLTFELSSPILYELGLEAALDWLADQMQEKHALRFDLKDDGQPKPLDNSCRVIAFRAVRELLFNIVKHARAKSATISIKRDGDTIHIDIEDDGLGFDTSILDNSASGLRSFGLFSIRERLQPLGGHMEIQSEPERGTRVRLVLPLACDAENSGDNLS